jgi:Uma2 family endonuclease
MSTSALLFAGLSPNRCEGGWLVGSAHVAARARLPMEPERVLACWVRPAGAEPVGTIGSRLSVWAASDVLLVVEVADETLIQDLNVKAKLYGQAGYPVYWVITQEAIYEHTGPIPTGYRTRVEYLHGERIRVPYTSTDLAIDDLIAPRSA